MSETEKDATEDLAHVKGVIDAVVTDEKAGVSWVKTHVALLIGLAAFILGWATRFIHS